MTKPPRYWVRLGDAGDYDSFDDLEDLASWLVEAGVKLPTTWIPTGSWVRGGLEAPGYEGLNYISLYVGDANANLVRDLNETEKQLVESTLKTPASNL